MSHPFQPEAYGIDFGTTFESSYPGIELVEHILGGEFEGATQESVEAMMDCLRSTLRMARVPPSDVEVVCCTGGTARVYFIAERLAALLPNADVHALSSFKAVVDGLALRARQLLENGPSWG